jgi:hypothetical protein
MTGICGAQNGTWEQGMHPFQIFTLQGSLSFPVLPSGSPLPPCRLHSCTVTQLHGRLFRH